MLGLLLPNSLRYSQYAFKYSQILKKHGINFEIIFWNRDGYSSDISGVIPFNDQMDDFLPIWKKIPSYFRYVRFINKTVNEKKYDGLIVFTSQLAVMIMPLLFKTYKGRYIFDYRDISKENKMLYRLAVGKIASCSRFTAISSPSFRKVIGFNRSPYVISHNERGFSCIFNQKEPSESGQIRVAFWGTVRQLDFNKLVCQRFGSDHRFSLVYHGSGCNKELESYCMENGFTNIFFTGVYDESQVSSFARTTDLLLNAYDNDAIQGPAYTVKYYDSLKFGIPMLVTKGCAMSKSVQANYLGLVVDWNDSFCMDSIFRFYTSFNQEKYQGGRKREIERIEADDKLFEDKLSNFAASVLR